MYMDLQRTETRHATGFRNPFPGPTAYVVPLTELSMTNRIRLRKFRFTLVYSTLATSQPSPASGASVRAASGAGRSTGRAAQLLRHRRMNRPPALQAMAPQATTLGPHTSHHHHTSQNNTEAWLSINMPRTYTEEHLHTPAGCSGWVHVFGWGCVGWWGVVFVAV